jgi:hypothetical protein
LHGGHKNESASRWLSQQPGHLCGSEDRGERNYQDTAKSGWQALKQAMTRYRRIAAGIGQVLPSAEASTSVRRNAKRGAR